MIGATQNSQSSPKAQPPWKIATPVERAGLTEVFVIGIDIRWIKVKAKPMAIGAKPFGALSSVAPMIMIKKNAVSTISATNALKKP